MKYYLYNRLATCGVKPQLNNGQEAIDAIGLDYAKFFAGLKSEDEVVIIGGDTSINHFIKKNLGYKFKNNIYLKDNNTGNDFLTDIGGSKEDEILINEYLENLPIAKINGIDRPFINGVGVGLDGYCCEVAEDQKASNPTLAVNYTNIAIKGLLFKFKPCHASVEVDGQKYEFDNVWIVSTMKGRYYGGGMKIAPDQDRKSDHLTVVVYMSRSKLRALTQFPSINKGEHVKNTEMVKVLTGNKIRIKLDRPVSAQVDGDTVLNVEEYTIEYKKS